MLGGTGTAAQIGCPAAGKTGTTDEFNDAWFVGYTPAPLDRRVGGLSRRAGLDAGHAHRLRCRAAPGRRRIWHDFMTTAHGDNCDDFPVPRSPPSSHRSSASTRTPARPARASTTTPGTTEDHDHDREEVRPALLRGRAARCRRRPRRRLRTGAAARERPTRGWRRRWRREWRRRHRRPRLIAAARGRARPDRSYRGHAQRPQRPARPLDRRRRGRHADAPVRGHLDRHARGRRALRARHAQRSRHRLEGARHGALGPRGHGSGGGRGVRVGGAAGGLRRCARARGGHGGAGRGLWGNDRGRRRGARAGCSW